MSYPFFKDLEEGDCFLAGRSTFQKTSKDNAVCIVSGRSYHQVNTPYKFLPVDRVAYTDNPKE